MELLDHILRILGHRLGLPPQYVLTKRIGVGAEGEVWLAMDARKNRLVAVKLVQRGCPPWQLQMVRREACTLARLGYGHVNITQPLEAVLTTKHFAVVQEFVSGGTLSEYILEHQVDEPTACYLLRQLAAAISFCHSHSVAYRDIKPNNLLLSGSSPPTLKLCDFGLAQSWEGREDPLFTTLAGTPGYMPPEIVGKFVESRDARQAAKGKGKAPPEDSWLYNGIKADVYSMGVLLCVLLLHRMPWEYERYAQRLPNLEAMRAAWKMSEQEGATWRASTPQSQHLSPDLQTLLDGMLAVDARTRWDLNQVLASAWFNQELPPQYTAALQAQEAAQKLLEAAAPPFDQEQLEARLALVEQMVTAAGRKANRDTLVPRLSKRLDLTTPLPMNGMGAAVGIVPAGASKTGSGASSSVGGGSADAAVGVAEPQAPNAKPAAAAAADAGAATGSQVAAAAPAAPVPSTA